MGLSTVPTRVQLRKPVEENHVNNLKKTREEVLKILTRRKDYRIR